MTDHRVGVIGCGGVGVHPAKGLVGMDNASQVACCDLNQEVLASFQEEWSGTWDEIQPYTDYRSMLAEQRLDGGTIATPDDRHADVVVDAANAGVKAIFCEKPLCTSMEDAYRMRDAVEASGVSSPSIIPAGGNRFGRT